MAWVEIGNELINLTKFRKVFIVDSRIYMHGADDNESFYFKNSQEAKEKYEEIKRILKHPLSSSIL